MACCTAIGLTVIVALLTSFTEGLIEITQGPSNVTAYIGESVTLQCLYTGTVIQPKWRIGGITYTSSNLPAGYVTTNEGLHIPSVWAQLNNTVHVCFFTVFAARRGRIENIESQPGIITVRSRSNKNIERQPVFVTVTTSTTEELNQKLLPTELVLSGSNTGYLSSSSIRPTLQLSPAENSYFKGTSAPTKLLTIEYSSWPSPSATPQKNTKRIQTPILLISGISSSMVVFLLICVSVIISLTVCFITTTHKKQKTEKPQDPAYEEPTEFTLQEAPTQPAYEEPAALCKLQTNIAYEISTPRIKTAKNEAYEALSTT